MSCALMGSETLATVDSHDETEVPDHAYAALGFAFWVRVEYLFLRGEARKKAFSVQPVELLWSAASLIMYTKESVGH